MDEPLDCEVATTRTKRAKENTDSSSKKAHSASRTASLKREHTKSLQPKSRRVERPVSTLKPRIESSRLSRTPQKTRAGRQIPRNIVQDKEELYEEVWRLKQENRTLRNENNELKVEAKQTDHELARNEKTIQDLIAKLKLKDGLQAYGTSTHLIQSLKKQNKTLRKENKDMREEILALHKDIRLTNVNEIEVEAQMYFDECVRLRKMIEELIDSKKEEYETERVKEQDALIQTIRQENESLATTLKKKEKEYESKINEEQKEAVSNKKLVEEHEREIQILKEQLSSLAKDLDEKAKSEKAQKFTAGKMAEKDDAIRTLEMKVIEVKRGKDSEIRRLKEQIREYEVKRKEKEEAKAVPIEEAEIVWISAELRMRLISLNLPPFEFLSLVFSRCDDDSPVSIHELCRLLTRKPISLDYNKASALARYLIEPKNVPYNELLEKSAKEVKEGFSTVIEGVYHQGEVAGIQGGIKKKLASKGQGVLTALRSYAEPTGKYIEFTVMNRVNKELSLALSEKEINYLLYSMYKESNDLKRLPLSVLLGHLKELGCELEPQVESPIKVEVEEEILSSEEVFKAQRRFSDQQEQVKLPLEAPSEAGPPAKPLEPREKSINEEQMIEIAQRCFYTIAEQMAQKRMTVSSLYQDVVYKKKIEGEEVELITPLDFLNGLRKLGIEDLQALDYTCLIKVLAISDEEKHIRVNDLVQILEDYGITEMSSVEEQLIEELRFEDLDKISMVLMLALTEYLIKAKVPLYDLFGGAIYKQDIEVDGKQIQVDLINSNDFFEILKSIGINTEEKEHQNLRLFLTLDPNYPDKLLVKKLKKGIEEFAVNEELRIFAQHCYQELVEEDQLGEAPKTVPRSIQSPSGNGGGKGGVHDIEFSRESGGAEPGNTTF